MTDTPYAAAAALARIAERLRARSGWPQTLPALWLFTDPERTPDPAALAEALPCGAGVVYRHFGRDDRRAQARALAAIARRRGLVLLIAADPGLARSVGAHGVHWPERLLGGAGVRSSCRGGGGGGAQTVDIMTAAAHGARGVRAAFRAGCDLVFLSPVFASASRSAGRPLGPARLAVLARTAPLPVCALGGVNRASARRLEHTGAYGVAAIEALTR